MTLRIGFGVTSLARGVLHNGVDGIGQMTRELYNQMVGTQKVKVLPVSFGHDAFTQIDPNCTGLLLPRFGPLVGFSTITNQSILRHKKLEQQIDIFHATDHYIPKLSKVPVVATIHDAIPFSNPEWTPLKHRLLISPVFRMSAHWAQRLITVSHFSKTQIVNYFGIAPEKISVIPNGVNDRWYLPVEQSQFDDLHSNYCLPKKYIVFVGTLQPRKNLERLIQAYKSLPSYLMNEFGLILVGRAGWGCDKTVKFINHSTQKHNIKWLSYLPQDHLATLVKGASCLALPSLAEGFGLPVVEAFAAGVPVLTSNTTSIPEVAGDAAQLVDPTNVQDIAEGLEKILDNPSRSAELITKGLMQAQQFSWKRTAEETLAVYRSLIK